MQLGFVSAVLPEYSLDELLRFAAAEGFACVEVMCWPVGKAERKYAGVTHVEVCGMSRAKADDVLACCDRHGVSLSSLGYYPNPLDPDPAVATPAIDHLRQVITAAAMLGVKTVTTFAGRDWKRTVEDNWPRFLEVWRPLAAFAEAQGVRIGIENCPMLFTADEWPGGKNLFTTPAIWRRGFAEINSPALGLNYDPSHFVLLGIDPLTALAEFRDRLFHLHMKDVRLDPAAIAEVGRFDFPNRWHQPRIPGFGEIDCGEFLAEVRRVGYDGPVCIEVEDETFGRSLNGRIAALRTARNMLAAYFP